MNYSKLDAALALAVREAKDSEERNLGIFIDIGPAPDTAEAAVLERLGVSGVASRQQLLTATLSASGVAELSDRPWVRYLRLSQKLRPVAKFCEKL
jgi:hypothetical protein